MPFMLVLAYFTLQRGKRRGLTEKAHVLPSGKPWGCRTGSKGGLLLDSGAAEGGSVF